MDGNRTANPEVDDTLTLRSPDLADASSMHGLAIESGLDVNSEYSYLMVCHYFASTSIVAEVDGAFAGFISGFRVPEAPPEVFVWQVAVAADYRGRGVAGGMLDALVRLPNPSGTTHLQATVTPSNAASIRTFTALAERLNCPLTTEVAFEASHFASAGHEEEILYRIGPFQLATTDTTPQPQEA